MQWNSNNSIFNWQWTCVNVFNTLVFNSRTHIVSQLHSCLYLEVFMSDTFFLLFVFFVPNIQESLQICMNLRDSFHKSISIFMNLTTMYGLIEGIKSEFKFKFKSGHKSTIFAEIGPIFHDSLFSIFVRIFTIIFLNYYHFVQFFEEFRIHKCP